VNPIVAVKKRVTHAARKRRPRGLQGEGDLKPTTGRKRKGRLSKEVTINRGVQGSGGTVPSPWIEEKLRASLARVNVFRKFKGAQIRNRKI